jgi:hypothetical protein
LPIVLPSSLALNFLAKNFNKLELCVLLNVNLILDCAAGTLVGLEKPVVVGDLILETSASTNSFAEFV